MPKKIDGRTALKAALLAAGFQPDLRSRDAYKLYDIPNFRIDFGKKSARLEEKYADAWRGVSDTLYFGQVTEAFVHDWATWALGRVRGERGKREPDVPRTASQDRARDKGRQRSAEAKRLTDGPGFYVTNGTTSGLRRAINHEEPFKTLDAATEFAKQQLHNYISMRFTYLLPVEIFESKSRQDAEMGDGTVWWIDGKRKAAPVDPRQLGFEGVKHAHHETRSLKTCGPRGLPSNSREPSLRSGVKHAHAYVRRVHIGDTLEMGDLPPGKIAMVNTDDGWAVVHLGPGRHIAKIVLDGASYKAAKHVYLAERERG